jgi:hypothetical protein
LRGASRRRQLHRRANGGFRGRGALGLIDHLQDGRAAARRYLPRTVVVGGNTPFLITIADGNLPPGLAIDSPSGVLLGTPRRVGISASPSGDRCGQRDREQGVYGEHLRDRGLCGRKLQRDGIGARAR